MDEVGEGVCVLAIPEFEHAMVVERIHLMSPGGTFSRLVRWTRMVIVL